MIKIRTFSGDCFELKTVPGQTAAQVVYLSGLFEAPALCSGIGRCGRCRMRFCREDAALAFGSGAGQRPAQDEAPEADEMDLQILGPAALAQGWRLGCRHSAAAGQILELPPEIRCLCTSFLNLHDSNAKCDQTKIEGGRGKSFPPAGCGADLHTNHKKDLSGVMALDFGSTSLHALWLGDSSSKYEDSGSKNEDSSPEYACHALVAPNPQLGAGSDIMSRLAWAAEADGREQLSRLSQAAVRRLLNEAEAANRKDAVRNLSDETPASSREVVLAANPAMVYLLLGKNAAGLSRAPYRLDYRGGCYEHVPGLPPFWISPLISPFIGGDISAGFAFLALNGAFRPEYPFVLADLGTNGELLLALDKHTALATSLPLGPALEGSGMLYGAEARPESSPQGGQNGNDQHKTCAQQVGIITSFNLSPQGLVPVTLPPNTMPQGISGSGYISLAYNLRKLNLLNSDGHFVNLEPTQFSPPAFLSQTDVTDFPRFATPSAALPGRVSSLAASQPDSRPNQAISPLAGHLPGPLFSLARRLGHNLQRLPGGEPYWPVCGQIGMSAGDVEELLKIKAAFSLGLKLLLKKAGIPARPATSHQSGKTGKINHSTVNHPCKTGKTSATDKLPGATYDKLPDAGHNGLAAIYLAGALGRHIESAALTGLGFVPENLGGRIRPVGNTSLAGAALLAGSPQKQRLRAELCRWAEGVETLNLAAEPEFQQMFAAEMFFN